MVYTFLMRVCCNLVVKNSDLLKAGAKELGVMTSTSENLGRKRKLVVRTLRTGRSNEFLTLW